MGIFTVTSHFDSEAIACADPTMFPGTGEIHQRKKQHHVWVRSETAGPEHLCLFFFIQKAMPLSSRDLNVEPEFSE